MRFELNRRLIVQAGLSLPLAACAGRGDGEDTASARTQDRLIRLMSAEIRTFDPQVLTDLASASVSVDQFQGLTRFDSKGVVIPSLASGWTSSADGLNWRFTVRDGLKFSDGERIGPDTFVKSYRRLYDDALASPHRLFADLMETMQVEGDDVAVRLKAPYPALPALLAHPAFAAIPHHRIEELGNGWTNERPIVASGPYRARRWILNNRIEMERNPNWHGPPAAIGRIVWKPSEDALSTMRTFLAGEADITDGYPSIRTDWLREELSDPEGRIARSEPYLGTYYYVCNVRKPPFDDVRVRTALAMTIEREWLLEKVLRSENEAAYAFVPPQLSSAGRWQPAWKTWAREERLERAAALLAEAGYSPERPLRFQLRFNSSADHRRIAAGASAMWRPLGVEVELFNSEAALHFDALQRGDFEIARAGWVADLPAPENFLENLLGSAEGRNYSGYDNPAFNQAFDRALGVVEPDARIAAMTQAEAVMIRDWPVIPIYFYTNRALVAPRVGGWHENSMNSHPNYDLFLNGEDGNAAAARAKAT